VPVIRVCGACELAARVPGGTLPSWVAMIEPTLKRPRRVGHKGAAHIEPGNTLASFDAALHHGVDMIELDVLSEHADGGGRLLVAHDYEDMHGRTPLTFEQALEHLSGDAFAELELDVDVKLPGYELRVLEALREFELVERSLASSMFPESLTLLRATDPALRLGWSVPRVRRDYTTDMLTAIPALAMLTGYRAALPRRARAGLSEGRFDAIMAHWRVVTPRLVRAVREGGGELYVWTVDDARMIQRLSALGVDAIITNDPRLFDT
jgi:glycerophosphoryl diester phosphodiesterase